ncbi:hypothetical protein FO519_007698 [Halicephalobus sp. NKZ332]|nr:hypothetical protein FO519_007698 [Halicephalobus sp. NKZ332]
MARSVQHCGRTMKFFIDMNGKESILEYRKVSNAVLDMFHTEVPPEHQGKGYAAQLVKEAFKYAKQHDYKVIPSCSYVVKYAKEMATPEEKSLIEDGDRKFPN